MLRKEKFAGVKKIEVWIVEDQGVRIKLRRVTPQLTLTHPTTRRRHMEKPIQKTQLACPSPKKGMAQITSKKQTLLKSQTSVAFTPGDIPGTYRPLHLGSWHWSWMDETYIKKQCVKHSVSPCVGVASTGQACPKSSWTVLNAVHGSQQMTRATHAPKRYMGWARKGSKPRALWTKVLHSANWKQIIPSWLKRFGNLQKFPNIIILRQSTPLLAPAKAACTTCASGCCLHATVPNFKSENDTICTDCMDCMVKNIWSTFTNVYSILTTWENACPYCSKNKIWKPWKHRFVVPTVGRHNIRTVALNLDRFVIWVATSPLSLSLSKGTCIERSKSSNILVTKRTRDPTHRVWKNLHGWHSKLIFLQKKVEHLVWVASLVQWGRWLRLSYCTSFASQGITQDNKVMHVQICFYLRGLGTIVGIYLGPINRTDPNNSIIHSPVCLHIYSKWFCFFAVVHHWIMLLPCAKDYGRHSEPVFPEKDREKREDTLRWLVAAC